MTVVEFMDTLLPPEDEDVSKEIEKILKKRGIKFMKSCKLTGATILENNDCVEVEIQDIKKDSVLKER